MSETFTQIYTQLIFSVKYHKPFINEDREKVVYSYLDEQIVKHGHQLITIGGTPDHVHILLKLNPANALSDLVRDIKRQSSYHINHHVLDHPGFHWEVGYTAYSYTRSQINQVFKFIENQKKYHADKNYHEEYIDMEEMVDNDTLNENMFKYKFQ